MRAWVAADTHDVNVKSYRLTVHYLRAIYVVFFGFVTLMQVVQAFNPGKGGVGLSILAVVGAAICLLLTIRGARAATRNLGTVYTASDGARSRGVHARIALLYGS